jgi:putative SOS response-associated peptidase YedK
MVNRRFTGYGSAQQLRQFFPIDKIACRIEPNDPIVPAREIYAIVKRDGQNTLEKLHWGFVPNWAEDTSFGYKLINARAETVAEKASFKNAFRKRRCLIIASGFYEWKAAQGVKVPLFITLPDGLPFAFAGLWEVWAKKGVGESPYKSCAIITTRASASFRKIHHRMPAILKTEYYEPWLDPRNQNVQRLINILNNGRITKLTSHPADIEEGS